MQLLVLLGFSAILFCFCAWLLLGLLGFSDCLGLLLLVLLGVSVCLVLLGVSVCLGLLLLVF